MWPAPTGRWERLFADLSAAMHEAEGDLTAEVADRTRSEFGRLRLVDRLRPATGSDVGLIMRSGAHVMGTLVDVGPDWVLVAERAATETLVPLLAVDAVRGLGRRSAHPGSEGRVAARLDLRYALRRLARDRAPVAATLAGGATLTGTCDRVGADFIELAEHPAGEARRAGVVRETRTVPLAALVLLRRQ